MRATNELLGDLVRSLSELALIAGWSSEELQDSIRKALADAGPRLGLSREASAQRLRVSRRALSTWAQGTIGNPRRHALDLVRVLCSKNSACMVGNPAEIMLSECFTSLLEIGLITDEPSVTTAVRASLDEGVERLRQVAVELSESLRPKI